MGNPVPLEDTEILGVALRKAVLDDCFALAPNLRAVDVEEIEASLGEEPLMALLMSFEASSEVYVACKDEEVFLMFGVVPLEDGGACVWLLGSDFITSVSKTFMKRSKRFLDYFLQSYSYLTNAIMETNTFYLKWIVFMGAELTHRFPTYGKGKKPFILFRKETDV